MKRSALLLAALLGGCASVDGRGLVPGTSTATEVRALMGAPDDRLALPEGKTAWYFSRLPEGRAMYVATFGADDVLLALEQRLTRENIAQLVPGTSTARDVRELFGPPGLTGYLSVLPREWWEYRYRDYQDRRVLWVQFSGDGVVREVLDMRDWSAEPPGRGRKGR